MLYGTKMTAVAEQQMLLSCFASLAWVVEEWYVFVQQQVQLRKIGFVALDT